MRRELESGGYSEERVRERGYSIVRRELESGGYSEERVRE